MPTAEKKQTIDELNDVFTRAKSAVLANYQGISAAQMTAMRAHMKERQLDFRVIKNTLAQKAAKNTPFELMESDFKGPMSLLVSFEDAVAPAKALADYAKAAEGKNPEVVCGIVEGKMVNPDQVKALSELPSKEVLIAQLLAVFQGPSSQFVRTLNGVGQKLVGTLDAIREKKGQEGG